MGGSLDVSAGEGRLRFVSTVVPVARDSLSAQALHLLIQYCNSPGGCLLAAGCTPRTQDLIAVVHVVDGEVLTIQNLMLSNAGMVAGYAPVPFTGLGLVTCFLWFFDVKRSLAPK